jgi:hypothetical protein
MKARLSELAANQCYRKLGTRKLRRKLADGRVVEIGRDRRVRYRKERGDPVVEIESCTLKFIGVGLRNNPETLIQVGSPKPLRRR